MTEEFNLSEKRRFVVRVAGKENWKYQEEDVKEFIKRLKEEIDKAHLSDGFMKGYTFEKVIDSIDKLAGEKLI